MSTPEHSGGVFVVVVVRLAGREEDAEAHGPFGAWQAEQHAARLRADDPNEEDARVWVAPLGLPPL